MTVSIDEYINKYMYEHSATATTKQFAVILNAVNQEPSNIRWFSAEGEVEAPIIQNIQEDEENGNIHKTQ